jgi:bifunctional DNase/RNase
LLHRMELQGVNLDVMTNQPVVILRDPSAGRFLPIWIGQFEATAILMEIQGVKPSRPLTHDLLKSVIETFEASIEQIVIDNLQDGTFFAKIRLETGSTILSIDARPSDAIALAVRTNTPIFVEEDVLDKASVPTEGDEEEQVEQFRSFLEDIRPEDFDAGPSGS